MGEGGAASQEQIDWVTKDLKDHAEAFHTVALMHKPYWIESVARGKPDALHTIFVQNGVDTVFTGHYHRYFAGEFDGIQYTSIGSSGGGTEEDPTGLMYHFGWATFDGKKLSITPIKMGAVLPWDQVSAADFLLFRAMNNRALAVGAAVVDGMDVPRTRITVNIRNLSAESEMADELVWKIPDGWSVEPAKTSVKIAPSSEVSRIFEIECDGPLFPGPTLTANCPYRGGRTFKVEAPLPVRRRVLAFKAKEKPTIDGAIDEAVWKEAEEDFFAPYGSEVKAEPVKFYFAYGQGNLYLAATCEESEMDQLSANVAERDGAVYGGDCVGYLSLIHI